MPLVISSIAFAIFTTLLWLEKLSEPSYTFLIAATAVFGLVLHGFDRLKELDLKNLRVTLREIKETQKELYVREEKLKSVAIPLAQIVAFTGASGGRWGSEDGNTAKRKWYKHKLEGLMKALDFDSKEHQEAKKFIEKYEAIDKLFNGRGALNVNDEDYQETKAALDKLSNEITELLKQDVQN